MSSDRRDDLLLVCRTEDSGRAIVLQTKLTESIFHRVLNKLIYFFQNLFTTVTMKITIFADATGYGVLHT